MTIKSEMESRLSVPCTLSEIAAVLDAPLETIRAYAYQLRDADKIERLNRTMPRSGRVGRPEYLWQRKYLQELA